MISAGQVPVPVTEGEPPRVDPAFFASIGEGDRSSTGDGGEGDTEMGGPGESGRRRRRSSFGDPPTELPEGLHASCSFELDG